MKSYIFFVQIGLILILSVPAQAEPLPKELWVATHGWAIALVIDDSCNVYVTGYDFADYTTIKYSADGNELWVRRYHGPGNDWDKPDSASAIALDGSGNVYVTGTSWGGYDTTGYDYATIKYSADGNELWVARYNGSEDYGGDKASAIAVDDSGNVYVTGESSPSRPQDESDYATIKYDTNGNELWVRRYNGEVFPTDSCPDGWSVDYASAIAVDSSGNVYVTGTTISCGTGDDYTTIKYDSDGNELWVRNYDHPGGGGDYAYAMAVDSGGNVYVTGTSHDWDTYYDYATVKYNSDGNEIWVRRYDGPGDAKDEAYAIALDGSGNVYVTGRSSGGYDTGYDYATIKYDSAGNELWVRRYTTGYSAEAIAVDGSGNVYVTGFGGGYATVKYDTNGNELWVRRYYCNAGWRYAIALDGSGNIYVTGYPVTIKYAQCLSPIAGDLNDDCKVDFTDFAIFALSWLGNDFTDLAIITEDWLECSWSAPEVCW